MEKENRLEGSINEMEKKKDKKCFNCGSKKDLVRHTINPNNLKKASFFNRVVYFLTFGKFGKKFEIKPQGEVFFCKFCHYKEHKIKE